MDVLLAAFPLATSVPEEPQGWASKRGGWEDSARCGMQTVRIDSNFNVISGMDVNSFWSELAGLHREEFVSRCFAGEKPLPTSELRQTVKLFTNFKPLLLARFQAKQATHELKTTYLHFSRNWGRDRDRGAGVLLRMKSRWSLDPQNWVYMVQNMVEVSAEEYEAARRTDPEACEGYMIPLVGSKSAAELVDPSLVEQESFAFLNSHPAGRSTLDHFADILEHEYAFVFGALERLSLSDNLPSAC